MATYTTSKMNRLDTLGIIRQKYRPNHNIINLITRQWRNFDTVLLNHVGVSTTAVHAMCAPEDEERQIVWEPDRARWEPVNSIQTMSSPKPAQMSRKFAAFLLVLTCFDSFVVCESYLLNSKVNRSIQRAVISFKEP